MSSDKESSTTSSGPGRGFLWIIVGTILGGVVICTIIGVSIITNLFQDAGPTDTPERSPDENRHVLDKNSSARELGEAIDQIATSGPKAEEAIPMLLDALRDDRSYVHRILYQYHIHKKASDALVKIGGPRVVKGLSELLADKSDKIVLRAVATLRRLKPPPEDAVPALLATWKTTKNDKVQHEVSALLLHIGGPKVVNGLSEFLADEDDETVMRAADTLGGMGSLAEEIVPALFAVLVDPSRENSPEVHRRVAASLGKIGGPKVAEGLRQLSDDDASAIASAAGSLTPVLESALAHKEPAVRARAAYFLAAIGPQSKRAIPALQKLLTDQDPHVRLEAAWALWTVVPQAKDTFPILVASLEDSDAKLSKTAQQRLNQIGPKDAWALDELLKNLDAEDKRLRLESVRAIGRIGPAANKAASILLGLALSETDAEFRAEIYRVTKKISK